MELTAEQHDKVSTMLNELAAPKGPLILVIDDDPAISLLVKKVLSQRGYHPLVTDNPFVALGLLRQKTPDLILLDINMPEMDGSELFSHIKELPNMKDAPVVYMTGLISPDEEQDFTLGAAMMGVYLAKPFTADKLLKVIGSILKK